MYACTLIVKGAVYIILPLLMPCREQLVHQIRLDSKDHEEQLERDKAKKMTELQVRIIARKYIPMCAILSL